MSVYLLAVVSLLAAQPDPVTQSRPLVAIIRCPQLSQLHLAAAAGDEAQMEALVRAGADINERLDCHGTPLQQAVQSGQTEAVRWLVQRGAQVEDALDDAVDTGNLPILTHLLRAGQIDLGTRRDDLVALAAGRGHGHILRWLLEQDPPSPQHSLDAALRASARASQFALADWLLSEGASAGAVDEHGQTALHLVSGARAADLTRLFLSAGARADAADVRGSRPLHHAASGGKATVVELLLKAGASPNVADVDGKSPLFKALSSLPGEGARLEVTRLLLAAEADPNCRDNQGVTGLMRAIQSHKPQAAALLLAAGADVTLRAHVEFKPLWSPGQGLSGHEMFGAPSKAPRGRGWTALHAAAMAGQTDMVSKLLSSGAKIDSPSLSGKTPLWVAASFGRVEMVGRLLSLGAVPMRPDGVGRTALHAAVLAGSLKGVRSLLNAGLKPDGRDGKGRTALHLACTPVTTKSWRRFGASRTIRQEEFPARRAVAAELIARKANLAATDSAGQTPLHLASATGLRATVDTLLLAGASVRARDKEGKTPSDLAERAGHRQVADTLSCWARSSEKRCLSTWRELRARQRKAHAQAEADAQARTEAQAEARAEAQAQARAQPKKSLAVATPPDKNGAGHLDQIERNRRNQLRQHGQRVRAVVVRKKEPDHKSLLSSSGKQCSKSLMLRFVTPGGRPAVAELCHSFSVKDWRRIRPGAKLEVVYLPDSLMRVGQNLVAAEIALARVVFP